MYAKDLAPYEDENGKIIYGFRVSIKKSIFAATNPTTPLNDAYHGGTSLFIWVYELRQLIFKAIQDIEISLLIKMIQVFSMEYGTFCSCVHIVAIAIK